MTRNIMDMHPQEKQNHKNNNNKNNNKNSNTTNNNNNNKRPRPRKDVHILTEKGLRWEEGLEKVFKQDFYESLVSKDECTGLVPFMVAASCGKSNLDTLFQMIMSDPSPIFDGMA